MAPCWRWCGWCASLAGGFVWLAWSLRICSNRGSRACSHRYHHGPPWKRGGAGQGRGRGSGRGRAPAPRWPPRAFLAAHPGSRLSRKSQGPKSGPATTTVHDAEYPYIRPCDSLPPPFRLPFPPSHRQPPSPAPLRIIRLPPRHCCACLLLSASVPARFVTPLRRIPPLTLSPSIIPSICRSRPQQIPHLASQSIRPSPEHPSSEGSPDTPKPLLLLPNKPHIRPPSCRPALRLPFPK